MVIQNAEGRQLVNLLSKQSLDLPKNKEVVLFTDQYFDEPQTQTKRLAFVYNSQVELVKANLQSKEISTPYFSQHRPKDGRVVRVVKEKHDTILVFEDQTIAFLDKG